MLTQNDSKAPGRLRKTLWVSRPLNYIAMTLWLALGFIAWLSGPILPAMILVGGLIWSLIMDHRCTKVTRSPIFLNKCNTYIRTNSRR